METLFSNKNGGHIPFLVVVIEDLKNRDRKNVSIMTTLGEKAKEENVEIADKLKKAFAEWIDNGHKNFDDENTIILRVELTDGLLFSHGTKFEF